jgi:hypothetical protein
VKEYPRKWVKIGSFAVPLSIKWNCEVDAEFKSSFLLTKNRFMNISKPIIVSIYKTD